MKSRRSGSTTPSVLSAAARRYRGAGVVCLATVAVDLGWLAATWPAESYGSADALGAGAWLLGVAVPLIVVSALGAVAAAGLLTGWRWSDWLAIPWVLFNAFGSGLMALLALVAGSGYGNLAPALATLPLVGAVSVGGSAAVGWLLLRGVPEPTRSASRSSRRVR